METKYIIVKDKNGSLRHFKSDWLHHETIARDNGYSFKDILECGIFLDKRLYIMECQSELHLRKKSGFYVGNQLNLYQDERLASWLKGRELESMIYYNKKAIGLREGD
jgi:hypothetical protein